MNEFKKNILIMFSIIILGILFSTFINEIRIFFISISVDGWMGFLGSVISVVGAYWVASYFYSKQSSDHFDAELESTKRRIYADKERFINISRNVEIIYNIKDIHKQKAQSKIIHILLDQILNEANELHNRLDEKVQYHTYVLDDIELLRIVAQQISKHLTLVKEYYSILGEANYDEQDENEFEEYLNLLKHNIEDYIRKSEELFSKLNLTLE